MIIGIDIGLDGGICINGRTIPMPTIEVKTKDEVMVLSKKNGKKQFYKTGEKAGEEKKVIKTKAKYKRELDVVEIFQIFSIEMSRFDYTLLAIEMPGTTVGNAAKSSRTVHINYGKILALAELVGLNIVEIPANVWKKKFQLSKEKEDSVTLAEKMSGKSFRTKRGALLDGEAESYLIYKYAQLYL